MHIYFVILNDSFIILPLVVGMYKNCRIYIYFVTISPWELLNLNSFPTLITLWLMPSYVWIPLDSVLALDPVQALFLSDLSGIPPACPQALGSWEMNIFSQVSICFYICSLSSHIWYFKN